MDSSAATASTDAESPTPSSNKRLLLLCGSDAGREGGTDGVRMGERERGGKTLDVIFRLICVRVTSAPQLPPPSHARPSRRPYKDGQDGGLSCA